jgi:hypothetical protein
LGAGDVLCSVLDVEYRFSFVGFCPQIHPAIRQAFQELFELAEGVVMVGCLDGFF